MGRRLCQRFGQKGANCCCPVVVILAVGAGIVVVVAGVVGQMFVVMPFKWSCAPFAIWSLLRLFCPCFWPFAMMATKLSWLCGEWFLLSFFFFLCYPKMEPLCHLAPPSFCFGDKLQCQIRMRMRMWMWCSWPLSRAGVMPKGFLWVIVCGWLPY